MQIAAGHVSLFCLSSFAMQCNTAGHVRPLLFRKTDAMHGVGGMMLRLATSSALSARFLSAGRTAQRQAPVTAIAMPKCRASRARKEVRSGGQVSACTLRILIRDSVVAPRLARLPDLDAGKLLLLASLAQAFAASVGMPCLSKCQPQFLVQSIQLTRWSALARGGHGTSGFDEWHTRTRLKAMASSQHGRSTREIKPRSSVARWLRVDWYMQTTSPRGCRFLFWTTSTAAPPWLWGSSSRSFPNLICTTRSGRQCVVGPASPRPA